MAPGLVWTGAENLASTGIRSPDRPARSASLYRLRYAGLHIWVEQRYRSTYSEPRLSMSFNGHIYALGAIRYLWGPLNRVLRGPQERFGLIGEEKRSLAAAGNRPGLSLVALATELCRTIGITHINVLDGHYSRLRKHGVNGPLLGLLHFTNMFVVL